MKEAPLTDPTPLLEAYVKYPSVSTDPAYHEGMEGARSFLRQIFSRLGFEVETVETDLHPIILAERKAPPGSPHILLYGHYDVQPADPFEKWTTDPFEPDIRNGRLYARGAADNKGPTAAQIAALARNLEADPDLPLHVTWLIEGEEETGSPSFPQFLKSHGKRLQKADLVILSDTGIPTLNQPTITTGLRGLCILEVEVIGPKSDLHSGVHGGPVMNPIRALTQICASLHDEDNRVNIPGFYDGVEDVESWERDELKKLPLSEADYKDFLGIDSLQPAAPYGPFESIRFAPTLEFNGIGGGYQGAGSKTVIPSRAFTKITCRLVPNQDPDKIQAAVKKAILERAPKGVEVKVKTGDGAPAYHITPPEFSKQATAEPTKKIFQAAANASEEVFKTKPLYLREGGSVPIIESLKSQTGLDSLMIGIFCPEDNLHAPNESFDLQFLENATKLYASLFKQIATP